MAFDTIIRGGTVVTASESYLADVAVNAGRVVAIGSSLGDATRVIDATGRLVVPGAIDVHTHFEHFVSYVGAENADDYESGTRAAAAGGITTILNFAFQHRGELLAPSLEHELSIAKDSHVDYGLHLCVTDLSVDGILDEVGALADRGFPSLKIFTSVGNYQLSDGEILRLLQYAWERGIMVNVHAEDHALISHLSQQHLARGETGVRYLPRARPPLAEALATWKVGTYARAIGAPVYFVHLSSREALDAVRELRARGGEVYVETRPVYLYLDDSKYELPDREGNKYVCLPPLRSKENQQALWEGLRNGEIQTYATDHAPWQSTQKTDPSKPFPNIPAGVSNVQTTIGMLFAEGVTKGRISANQFVAVTATNPAKLFGMWPEKGTIAVGADADIVLIDPQRKMTITHAEMHSKADYDPYEGYEGVGWPVLTMSRGEVIAVDGTVTSSAGRGRLLARRRFQRL